MIYLLFIPCIILSYLIINHYTLQDNSWFIKCLCTLALFSFYSSSVLILFDNDLILWNILFWFQFILMWIIFPFMISLIISDEQTIRKKIRFAIIDNIKTYLLITVLFLSCIVYLIVIDGIRPIIIINFMINMSNLYGIILFTICFGNGIGILVLNMFKNKSSNFYYSSYIVFSELESTIDSLYFRNVTDQNIDFTHAHKIDGDFLSQTCSTKNMIMYYRSLKQHSLYLIEQYNSSKAQIYYPIKKYIYGVFYILLGFSIIVITLSELFIMFPDLSLMKKINQPIPIVFYFLIFMTVTSTLSLFKLRLSFFYYMFPKSSNEVSLLRCMTMLLRLSTPLVYNFIMILSAQIRNDQQGIEEFIGPQLITIKLFPMFIIIIAALSACNFHTYILRYIGFKKVMLANYSNDSEIESLEGKAYIQKYSRRINY